MIELDELPEHAGKQKVLIGEDVSEPSMPREFFLKSAEVKFPSYGGVDDMTR